MNSELWKRAQEAMPGGVNSPVRSFKHVGGEPVFVERAQGAFIESADNRRYVDFCMGFGPHILGHSPSVVVEAVTRQLADGTSFGASHRLEVELCEELIEAYPFFERVRLLNSGTEAVMTAIRVARSWTSRSKILKFEGCYHGHCDALLVKSGSGAADLAEASSKGVSPAVARETVVARLDRPDEWERLFERHGPDLAAVIVEPLPANEGLYLTPRRDLVRLMELGRRCGALIIFDEVITGFRLGIKGACGEFDLCPDLVTLGKVIGGGLPLAALLGPAKLLDELAPMGGAYQAGTFAGNILSVTAGLACVRHLKKTSPYPLLERRTTVFAGELSALLSRVAPVTVRHTGSVFWFRVGEGNEFPAVLSESERALYSRLFHGLLARGVYLPASPHEVSFISVAHTDSILVEALDRINQAVGEL